LSDNNISSSPDYSKDFNTLGQNQKQIYEGVKSIKGDTTKIKQDTTIIKNQNYNIDSKVNQVGKNQKISYATGDYSQMRIYAAVGTAISVSSAGYMALNDTLKDFMVLFVVCVIIGLICMGAFFYLVYKKMKNLELEIQNKNNLIKKKYNESEFLNG